MLRVLRQSLDDVAEGCQRLVDGLRLLQLLPCGLALLQSLRASQVTKGELAGGDLLRLPVRRLDGEDGDEVRARGLRVHLRGGNMAPSLAVVDDLEQLIGTCSVPQLCIGDIHGALRILLHVQRRWNLPLRLHEKKVNQLVPVQLEHGTLHDSLCFVRVLAQHCEDLIRDPRHQAGGTLAAIHCVRLACPCLPVSEYRDVEAVDGGGDEAATLGEDIFLSVVSVEDGIEVVGLGCRPLVLPVQLHGERVDPPGGHFLSLLPLDRRPDACVNPDGSFGLLHLVVIPLPQGLLLCEGLVQFFDPLVERCQHLVCALGTLPAILQLFDSCLGLSEILLQLLDAQLLLARLAFESEDALLVGGLGLLKGQLQLGVLFPELHVLLLQV
mmetsp:Transcript_15858/g.43813  ORF Transcript_15858/g.43813 Transcript_15858/m.43813 type:complete len:383 (+) Transcript_15858:445-1593(+)